MRTDAEILQAVLRELERDVRIDERAVGVEAEDGVVTLSGQVSGWAQRCAAQRAAQRVAGVLDVANELLVEAPDTRVKSTTLDGTLEYLTH